MGGLRELSGARALGWLRLAAGGPALPRHRGLRLSQVHGGLGTTNEGCPRLGLRAEEGGVEGRTTSGMKEWTPETQRVLWR